MKKGSHRGNDDAGGQTPPLGKRLCRVMGFVLLPLCLCSCEWLTFDARQLQQPMVLNDNPFLGPTNACAFVLTNVDDYAATVEYTESTWLTTKEEEQQTHHTAINEAQMKAFEKIGGQTNRFIRNVTLKAGGGYFYMIFYVANGNSVDARGKVAEFHSPMDTNAPPSVLAGGTNP